MSLVPGKTSYIVFDGESQKGYWPKYKKFCVLDKSLNPEDYKVDIFALLKRDIIESINRFISLLR